jgi:hypothetical protein
MTMVMNKVYELIGKEYKITFDWLEEKQGYGYTLFVSTADGQWRKASDVGNPLVRGDSFNLYPSEIQCEQSAGVLNLAGKGKALSEAGEEFSYDWVGTVRYEADNDWLQIDVQLLNDKPIHLQMVDGIEPEITMDMGLLPPYDRGDHVWFKTSINNPTKWNDEAYGNDFPALYYYDSYFHYDLMMFFDMTRMDWMSRENIARFLNYRCGFRRSYRPAPEHELGMYADGFSGKTFPAGPQSFTYYMKARQKLSPPTETTALKELVDHCLQLIPSASVWPGNATDWQDFTERCTTDLMDPQCWNTGVIFEDYILNMSITLEYQYVMINIK